MVGDPLFQMAVALGFAVVFLVVVGGELLGGERRGTGLRWLERLPSGLAGAFRAKLAFFFLSTAGATLAGYATALFLAWLRHSRSNERDRLGLILYVLPALVWSLWTFAASAWTLRGGLALLAAALVLGVVGFPIWRVMEAGYHPYAGEICSLMALLVPGALAGAWLGFAPGGRRGSGTIHASLLGLAPALPVLIASAVWSAHRIAQHEAFDPTAADFHLQGLLLTDDGKTAFAAGVHTPDDWDLKAMPKYALRIDLETGSVGKLGHMVVFGRRFDMGADGRPCSGQFVIAIEEQ